jgi:predicted nicotinamide N-methyase
MILNTNIPEMHKVRLRNTQSSPWCYAATIDPTNQIKGHFNFLATQVWPSARAASFFLEERVDKSWKVCELGCGPALPSLTIAGLGLEEVIATDIDLVGLDMAKKAAEQQGLTNLSTRCVDLTGCPDKELQGIDADLFFMSDVFENSAVARGAASFTKKILDSGSRVWTFSQSDRAQRDIYLKELQHLGADGYGRIEWRSIGSISSDLLLRDMLLLIEVDELQVKYN